MFMFMVSRVCDVSEVQAVDDVMLPVFMSCVYVHGVGCF